MSSTFFTRLARFFILLLFQVLVFNQVHLFDYITPLMIGYMVVCFRCGTSRVGLLLWGFATGLAFDMFSNTAGMGSSAMTLIAMMQPSLLTLFAPRDATEDFTPTFRTLGFWTYLLYVFILMFVLHSVFYLLDAFTLSNWQLTLFSIGGGTLMTTILTVFIELLVHPKT
ncbi:MAG: rod shape-determining protein MreD [Prevotellaceae bacterium]|nr:rod shape-determining protein MreD [Prevotellaceae bacterium]